MTRRTAAVKDAWQQLCEQMGTRCNHVEKNGQLCDGGKTTGEYCDAHQPTYTVTFNRKNTIATVVFGGRGFRYTVTGIGDVESIAMIGEQLRHRALTGRYCDRLSSEEPITAYGRVFRVGK